MVCGASAFSAGFPRRRRLLAVIAYVHVLHHTHPPSRLKLDPPLFPPTDEILCRFMFAKVTVGLRVSKEIEDVGMVGLVQSTWVA